MDTDSQNLSVVDVVLVAVAIAWAATHTFVRILLNVMTPLGMSAARFTVMLAISLAILLATRPKFERKDWAPLFAVSMMSYGLYQFAYVYSIDKSGAFVSGVLLSTIPIFSLILARIFGKESASVVQVLGVVAAFLCTCAFMWSMGVSTHFSFLGAAFSLAASILFAGYGVFVKPLAHKYPPLVLISAQVLIGGIPLVAAGLPDLIRQNWGLLTPSDWLILLAVAIVPAFLAYAAWNWAISKVGIAHTTAYALLVPILASAISLIFLHEEWNIVALICAAGLIASLAIVRLSNAKQPVVEVD